MGIEFNTWFPTSRYGTNALNVKDFGAIGDGTGRQLGGIYGDLPTAQADFPSATALTDYVDWAAITECFKQAFTTGGVANATNSHLNKPVFFPAGRYLINRPLWLVSVQGGWIFGSGGGSYIHNEGLPGSTNCVQTNGFSYGRVENLSFTTVGGANAMAFDLNWDGGTLGLVATNACTFSNCHFISLSGGIAMAIANPASYAGSGIMSSEIHFYHCTFNQSAVGIYIAAGNALNYSFIGCGGISNTTCWLQVSAGGMVTVVNGSLAGNALDIDIGADTATIISTRTESKRFVKAGGPTSIISCSQAVEGKDAVFCQALAPVHMTGCYSQMGRVNGGGPVTVENCNFNADVTFSITSIANNGSGLIRVDHQMGSSGSEDLWLDGDEVKIEGVTGSGAASINGVWTISKIDTNTIDLVGSTHGGLTYTGAGTTARIRPGPRYHLKDNIISLGYPSDTAATGTPRGTPGATKTKDFSLLWLDSGTIIDNNGATAPVTITLPGGTYSRRGTRYEFVVVTAQQLKIKVVGPGTWGGPPGFSGSPRIIDAGGSPSTGTEISSSTLGATLELMAPDMIDDPIGNLWVVTRKTGTWTVAGTPEGTARAAEEAKLRSRYGAPSRRLPQAREPVA